MIRKILVLPIVSLLLLLIFDNCTLYGVILRKKKEKENSAFATKLRVDFAKVLSDEPSALRSRALNFEQIEIEKAVYSLPELDLRPDARILIRYSGGIRSSNEPSWFLFILTCGIYPLIETATANGTFDFIDRKTGRIVLSKNVTITGVQTFGWFPLLASPFTEVGQELHLQSSFSMDRWDLKIAPIFSNELKNFLSNVDPKDIKEYFLSGETYEPPAILIGRIEGKLSPEIEKIMKEEFVRSGFKIVNRNSDSLREIVNLQTFENSGLVTNPIALGKLQSSRYMITVDSSTEGYYLKVTASITDLQSGGVIWIKQWKTFHLDYKFPLDTQLTRFSKEIAWNLKVLLLHPK